MSQWSHPCLPQAGAQGQLSTFRMSSFRTLLANLPLFAQQLSHVLYCLPSISKATARDFRNAPISELSLHCPGCVVPIEVAVDQGSQPEILKREVDFRSERFLAEAAPLMCVGNPNASPCGSVVPVDLVEADTSNQHALGLAFNRELISDRPSLRSRKALASGDPSFGVGPLVWVRDEREPSRDLEVVQAQRQLFDVHRTPGPQCQAWCVDPQGVFASFASDAAMILVDRVCRHRAVNTGW